MPKRHLNLEFHQLVGLKIQKSQIPYLHNLNTLATYEGKDNKRYIQDHLHSYDINYLNLVLKFLLYAFFVAQSFFTYQLSVNASDRRNFLPSSSVFTSLFSLLLTFDINLCSR